MHANARSRSTADAVPANSNLDVLFLSVLAGDERITMMRSFNFFFIFFQTWKSVKR